MVDHNGRSRLYGMILNSAFNVWGVPGGAKSDTDTVDE